jgi:hypothetical protein
MGLCPIGWLRWVLKCGGGGVSLFVSEAFAAGGRSPLDPTAEFLLSPVALGPQSLDVIGWLLGAKNVEVVVHHIPPYWPSTLEEVPSLLLIFLREWLLCGLIECCRIDFALAWPWLWWNGGWLVNYVFSFIRLWIAPSVSFLSCQFSTNQYLLLHSFDTHTYHSIMSSFSIFGDEMTSIFNRGYGTIVVSPYYYGLFPKR